MGFVSAVGEVEVITDDYITKDLLPIYTVEKTRLIKMLLMMDLLYFYKSRFKYKTHFSFRPALFESCKESRSEHDFETKQSFKIDFFFF